MSARAFEVTLISESLRVVRNVIAASSIQATRIGIMLMPEQDAPLAIICKPVSRVRLPASGGERDGYSLRKSIELAKATL